MGNSESSSSSNPPEDDRVRNESLRTSSEESNSALKFGAGIAGAALLAWGASRVMSGSSDEKKMMKAPGRDDGRRIPRKGFEEAPGHYFRRLHEDNKAKKAKQALSHK
ncbi:hypothetical protein QJS04_geneDACA011191 [Acorus gramineus]|uniref:Uncharacterized protein n=1 Tax=Acorus gramineus TaxID=55184 RepID=A0AAV9AMY3_ACOGR|nr:hypothetical protein QJS04_geneDACA011191 [Acorus gramineus]